MGSIDVYLKIFFQKLMNILGSPRYKTPKEKEEGVFFIDQCAGWIHPQTTG